MILAWLFSCAPPSSAGPGGDVPALSCDETFDLIERRDWTHFRGLPPDCAFSATAARFSPRFEGLVAHHLGTAAQPASHQELLVPGFARPIDAWVRDGNVVLIEVSALENERDLLDTLGPPAAALDYYFITSKKERGARIYPDRGLALLSDQGQTALLKLYLFSPTTAEDYTRSLHHPIAPTQRRPR